MPGIDWQLWFVGLQAARAGIESELPDWVVSLMLLLQKRDPDVMSLMEPCPVRGAIAHIRCTVWDYRYSDEPGYTWKRKYLGEME